MNKKIIIKAEYNKYFFNELKTRIPIYDMYIKKIDMISPINIKLKKPIMILGKWKKVIKEYDTAIIFDTMYNPYIAKTIKKKNKKCKTILFFWNIIDSEERKNFLKDKNIDEFWTFDYKDAKKYHMKLNTQFYSKDIIPKKKKEKVDVYFLGRDKNRKEEIIHLENKLKDLELNTKIEFLEDEYKFVDYDTYLENVFDAKCLLDFNRNNQVGLSLRMMEALFFQKKCITNNKSIKEYDFYNPNNIFILGIDNLKDITSFLEKPYHKIKKDIIEKYDIQEWLNRF